MGGMEINTIAENESGKQNTFAPVAVPVPATATIEPEFIPMPPPGKACPYSGLQRGMLYALAKEGLIRTVSLRRKGTTRGRRLIVFASLRDYLRGLNSEQNGKTKEGE